VSQAKAPQKVPLLYRPQGVQQGPSGANRRPRWPWILLAIVAFLVVVGGLAVVSLYQGDPAQQVYSSGGYRFRLAKGKSSSLEAVIVSRDTTTSVPAQVRAILRTGNLWNDLLAQLKNNTRTYPVAEVSGLNSKTGPIDLSALAATTKIALNDQSIRYATANFSLEATQTGEALMVQTASIAGAAALPTQLFTGGSGSPLKVELAPRLEAKLLGEVVQVASAQVQKSSDYESLIAKIKQTVQPYAAVMSASATQAVQAKLDSVKNEEVKMQDYEGVLLNVPLISQLPEFKAGCEAASTAMLISYAGHSLSTADVIEVMPYSGNPAKGYVGNPRTWDGYTIYPSAMKSVVQKYLGTGVDLTGCDMATIHAYLRAGKPVVCWLGPGALPGISPHCVCVTGYKQGMVYYNDPYLNTKNRSVSEKSFASWRAGFGDRAMSY